MSDVADFISEIETMYRREYKDEENSFIRDRLFKKAYDQKILIRALEEIERIDSDYLPAPKKVVALADKASHDMAPKENPVREENDRPEKTDLQFNMFKVIIRMFRSGKHSRQDILDKVRHADSVDNSKGWHNTGMALERHYQDHNLDLSKQPNNYTSYDV